MAEECVIEVVVPNFMLKVEYTNVYRERHETQLAVTNVFAELPPIRQPHTNPYLGTPHNTDLGMPPNPYLGMPPNPYLGGSRTHPNEEEPDMPPNHTAYYKIIRIENNGLNGFNLICYEGSYDGYTSTWGPNEIIYTTTRLCEMLRNGRIILPRNLPPNYEQLMRSIKGGTTKKRRFIKSKKYKRSKRSRSVRQSRNRKGGGFPSEYHREKYHESKQLFDKYPIGSNEREELRKTMLSHLDEWEKSTDIEKKAKEIEKKAKEIDKKEFTTSTSTSTSNGGKSRRRHHRRSSKKHKKARKSRRANRRHSRKH